MERNISNEDIRITTFPGKWDEDDLAANMAEVNVASQDSVENMVEVNVSSQ